MKIKFLNVIKRGGAMALAFLMVFSTVVTAGLVFDLLTDAATSSGNGRTLTVDKTSYTVGEAINVTATGSGTDWVGILAHNTDGSVNLTASIDYHYVAKDGYTSGSTHYFSGSQYTPGTYTVVLIADDATAAAGYGASTTLKQVITITAAAAAGVPLEETRIEDGVLAASPQHYNTMLVSTGAAVTISNRTNGSTSDENSYEAPEYGYGKKYLVDGAVAAGNSWTTHPSEKESSASKTVTVTLDLMGSFNVRSVSLFANGRGTGKTFFPASYEVKYSTNGTSYTSLATSSGNSANKTGYNSHTCNVTARYIQVIITSRGGKDANGYLAQLAEIAVFAANVTASSYATSMMNNLVSTGATVTATSSAGTEVGNGTSLSKLVDGTVPADWDTAVSTSDYWYSLVGQSADNAITLNMTLADKSYINNIALFMHGSGEYFPNSYKIYVSEDGSTYTQVGSASGIAAKRVSSVEHSFAPIWAKYVRVVFTTRQTYDNTTAICLSEIAVYGTTSSGWAAGAVNNDQCAVSTETIGLDVGETATVNLLFWGAVRRQVVYTSSDPSVATVDQNGKVTGRRWGTATITMTDLGSDITKQLSRTCEVYVVGARGDYEDNLMISVYWPPHGDLVANENQWKLMAEAGINWILGRGEGTVAGDTNQNNMAALCNKYGMGMTMWKDGYSEGSIENASSSKMSSITSIANGYKNTPSAYGFFMKDEPWNPNVYANAFKAIKQADPTMYAHLNLLPNYYAPYMVSDGVTDYAKYEAVVNDWIQVTAATGYELDYVLFDNYLYNRSSDPTNRYQYYFDNNRVVWELGLKNGVKTGTYLQTTNINGSWRETTEPEIRFNVYSSLAYGMKQLSYFTWSTPYSNNYESFTMGMVDPSGNPTSMYYYAKTINRELHNIGKTLANVETLAVYQESNFNTFGQPSAPDSFFAQVESSGTNYSVTTSWHRDMATGRNYVMVVNNDTTSAMSFKVKFNSNVTKLYEVSKIHGGFDPLTMSGQYLNVTLAAGDGMLIALPDGVDFYTAPTGQPAKGNNLAADAIITCPTSEGIVMTSSDTGAFSSVYNAYGYFISALNDGERTAGSSNIRSWITNGTNASYIQIDFGRKMLFDRVDLYADTTKLPTGIKISVSDDGSSWTAVKTLTNVNTAAGSSNKISVGAQYARYVKIDFTSYASGVSNASIGEVEVYQTACGDTNNDHKCDVCGATLTSCSDNAADGNHTCDVCGKANVSSCADTNKDHKCDDCGKTGLSACTDANNDHICDYTGCKKTLSDCTDTNNDHNCDTCGETLTTCADEDGDNSCDVCGDILTTAEMVGIEGLLYYYENGEVAYGGLVKVNGSYYYANYDGKIIINTRYWATKISAALSDEFTTGYYLFGEDGKMITDGIHDGYYYEDLKATYKGLVKVDGDYYFAAEGGKIVTDTRRWVTKTGDTGFASGYYTFGADGRLVR